MSPGLPLIQRPRLTTSLVLAAFFGLMVVGVVGSLRTPRSHAASNPAADLNHDNQVNVFDLSIFLSHWAATGAGAIGDINADQVVNVFDLSVLLSSWGAVTATPTPTPTATASPGARSCPAFPAFPDTSCTGVPAGQSLATVTGDLGTSSNGQTIDSKLITGDLLVGNDNITVTNSRIKGRVVLNGHTGVTLRDVDLGPDACPASTGNYEAINGSGYTLIRTHVHNNNADLVRLAGGQPIVIQDSLLDQTCFYAGDHLDAVQFYDPGSVGHVTITHSNIDVRPVNSTDKGNSAIFWADDPGSGTTLTAYNNKLAGGQITTALYDATAGSGVVLDLHDNVYVKNSYAGAPCSYGTSVKSVDFNGTSGVKFTNNKLDDGSAVSCN